MIYFIIIRIITFIFIQRPAVAAGVFVAPNASVVGKVLLYHNASVRKTYFAIFKNKFLLY
jgi:hypothetical protein